MLSFIVVLYLLPDDGTMVPAFMFTSWESCAVAKAQSITHSMCKRVDLSYAPEKSPRPVPKPVVTE